MQPAMQILNTHQLIKDFQELGFKEKQAEGIVNFVVRSKEFDISRLATKDQLERVEERLKSEFKTEIKALEITIHKEIVTVIKWTVGSVIASIGILTAIFEFILT